MASFISPIFFLIVFLFSSTNAQNSLTFPITKDSATTQFFTTFEMGSNHTTVNAVIDIGAPFLWFSCDDYTSNTYAPITCNSTMCDVAKGSGCLNCNNARPGPGCTNNTCGAVPYNPFLEEFEEEGLGQDTFYLKNPKNPLSVPELAFTCVENDTLSGLASGTIGLLGLGRSEISLHKQVATKLNLPDKFSLCLPSSGMGKLSVGFRLETESDISKLSLNTTSLIINPVSSYPYYSIDEASDEYFIDVKSIRVDGVPLAVNASYFSIDKNGAGGTKISTIQNFTSVHGSIFEPLAMAFINATSNMKIERIAAVPPYVACFSSDSILKTPTGPSVPEIDLVLPEKDAYWRLSGSNLMVEIDQKTSCLALVEDGPDPDASIVIGAHQLEETFLEFDLVSSQLHFSSSLLFLNKSCSQL